MDKKYICINCGNEAPRHHNYCKWDCAVDLAIKNGAKVFAPNNLPITCIKASGLLLEHEHGDHPDYKFPVCAEFIGDKSELGTYHMDGTFHPADEIMLEMQSKEVHALIYSDGYCAITLYEYEYFMWTISDGLEIKSKDYRKGQWKLSTESLEKIKTNLCRTDDSGRSI